MDKLQQKWVNDNARDRLMATEKLLEQFLGIKWHKFQFYALSEIEFKFQEVLP